MAILMALGAFLDVAVEGSVLMYSFLVQRVFSLYAQSSLFPLWVSVCQMVSLLRPSTDGQLAETLKREFAWGLH